MPNRGRDIAPKLVAFRDVYSRYDYIFHIHSKKSVTSEAASGWRHHLLSTLSGSKEIIQSIFGAFTSEPTLGMIAANHYEVVRSYIDWGDNFEIAENLARRMNFSIDENTAPDFPSGSMFWTRCAALRPILDLNLTLEDFDAEAGQVGGTLAHALERLFFYSCEMAGLTWTKIGRPELLESHANLVSVDDGAELARHLSRHVPLLAPPHAHRRRSAFAPVLTVPRLVAADMQRHAMGLDNSEELPKIAVGVVSYNNDPLRLDRCLRSARAANILLLWDNGTPSTPAHDIVPSLIHKGGERNLGFGTAHNRLMEQAFASGADLYVALDPDSFFRPDGLARVARMIAARSRFALIECAQVPVDYPKPFDELSLRTNWASGTAMAIPRLIFETIGGFDESFFMYCEDVDLSWRARAHGFEVAICPNAVFADEVTSREISDATLAMIAESGVLLGRKWGSRPFARWAARQTKGQVEPRCEVAPVPHEWRDVADFDHGFSFSETRCS